ncbi:MAG: hypothetical protein GX846_10705 [Deltaproteobacteria bacterium]|nr:hypothetical protein [Deltaproteobacteria bacterium]
MGSIAQNAVIVSPGPDAAHLDIRHFEKRAKELQALYHFKFSMASVARRFRPDLSVKRSAKVLTD